MRGRRWWTTVLCILPPFVFASITGSAVASSAAPSQDRKVVLVLPGVTLDDLLTPDLTTLPRMIRSSTGTWVAVWDQVREIAAYGKTVAVPTRRDPARPFGVAADYEALLTATGEALKTSRTVWIEPGDTERAWLYAPLCLPGKAQEHRRVALERADRLLGALLRDATIRDVWLLAPSVDGRRGLVPFFWIRRGYGPGTLRSSSTRMTGVVTGPDLVATLAAALGQPYRGVGRQTEPVPWPRPGRDAGPVADLQRLARLSEQTESARQVAYPLVKGFLMLLLLGALVAIGIGRRLPRAASVGSLLLPALLLLDGARRAGRPGVALFITVVLAAAVGMAMGANRLPRSTTAPRISGRWTPWQAAAAVTWVSCALALLAGDVFRWSVMGYSVPLGVRFYGVGNEFMGWWVGSALLLSPGGRQTVRPLEIGLLIGTAALLAHPAFGADLGGGITALGAAAVAAWPGLRGRRRLLGVLALMGVTAVGLAAWDATRAEDAQTHLGRLAARVAQEGPAPLVTMALGKLHTNLRISAGFWGLLLAAGACLAVMAKCRAPETPAASAVGRLLPVAAVAFLINDSGVIAAALMLSYGVIAAASWNDHLAHRNERGTEPDEERRVLL